MKLSHGLLIAGTVTALVGATGLVNATLVSTPMSAAATHSRLWVPPEELAMPRTGDLFVGGLLRGSHTHANAAIAALFANLVSQTHITPAAP